ncbi:hypothetical protein [Phenylobacterium sp.]|uniref:hypothetical protein n=1 Tax=Phenylobacterium sp. TaxID=1871053 RepID=UPI00271753EE|nr:hypothetical protein [Phenylobacterium sp.]MDO8379214.1 hypothetical protein [Phenylobacterium sp.]
MTKDDPNTTAPALPEKGHRPPAAHETASERDTTMNAAARLVIEEPPHQHSSNPAQACGAPEGAAESGLSLAQLAGQWETLKDDAAEAWGRLNAADAAASRLIPPYPSECIAANRVLLDREDCARLDENARNLTWPRPDASPRVAAYDLWHEQAAAIESSFGVPGLDAAADRAQRAANCVAELALAIRPATAAEAALKFRILLAHYADGRGGFDQPEKVQSFQADLDHLAEISHHH